MIKKGSSPFGVDLQYKGIKSIPNDDERKQQRAFAAVFSQGQQLSQDHGKDGFGRRRTTE
ncbi:hypothetical protein [Desulfobulbus oralis]|uniref:hypothetical protein n=1 Tax=Desulfobulbus oralis TaxID=1986146 RepID=UPI0003A54948|nr:hypothetical protein [Desulfobulbus oralis]